jgi:hypothetical protein
MKRPAQSDSVHHEASRPPAILEYPELGWDIAELELWAKLWCVPASAAPANLIVKRRLSL